MNLNNNKGRFQEKYRGPIKDLKRKYKKNGRLKNKYAEKL